MNRYNPGDIAPQTGSYCVIDSNGNTINTVDVQKGDRLPPTQSSGYHYELCK